MDHSICRRYVIQLKLEIHDAEDAMLTFLTHLPEQLQLHSWLLLEDRPLQNSACPAQSRT